MVIEHLRNLVERWSAPLGPFLSYEDVEKEMLHEARRLGDDGAKYIIDAIEVFEKENNPLLEDLGDFASVYFGIHKDAMTEQLVNCVNKNSSEELVWLLRMCKGDERAANILCNEFDFSRLDKDWQITVLGALGFIGGDIASTYLDKLSCPPLIDDEEVMLEYKLAMKRAKVS